MYYNADLNKSLLDLDFFKSVADASVAVCSRVVNCVVEIGDQRLDRLWATIDLAITFFMGIAGTAVQGIVETLDQFIQRTTMLSG